MLKGTSISPDGAEQLLLCWSDSDDSRSREEVVQVIQSCVSEAVIRSSLQLNEKTPVYLIGKRYTGNGIVRSCRKEGSAFILTICTGHENTTPDLYSDMDPGILAVDNFLSEEQEQQILDEIQREEAAKNSSRLQSRTNCI